MSDWEFDVEEEDCMCKEKGIALFTELAYAKVKKMLRIHDDKEWLAYLLGEKSEDGYIVQDIHVPEQEVTAATCKTVDGHKQQKEYNDIPVVGWIHSHVDMDAYFSGTDEITNKQYDLSIVINNKEEYSGWGKKEFICGGKGVVDIDLEVMENIDLLEFTEQAKELIKENEVINQIDLYHNNELVSNKRAGDSWDFRNKKKEKTESVCDTCKKKGNKTVEQCYGCGAIVHRGCSVKCRECKYHYVCRQCASENQNMCNYCTEKGEAYESLQY